MRFAVGQGVSKGTEAHGRSRGSRCGSCSPTSARPGSSGARGQGPGPGAVASTETLAWTGARCRGGLAAGLPGRGWAWRGGRGAPGARPRAVPGAQSHARRSWDVGAADTQTQAGDTDGPAGGQSRASPQRAEGAILNLKASSVPTRHHHA